MFRQAEGILLSLHKALLEGWFIVDKVSVRKTK
jgi:hypothetical protein